MKGRSLSLGIYYLIYMKLTDKQKKQIEEDLSAFTNEYAGKTKEERREKGQFLHLLLSSSKC